jgi:alpha-2-macroglobulin
MNRLRNVADRLVLLFCFCIVVLPFVLLSDASGGRGQRGIMRDSTGKDGGLIFRLSEGKAEEQQQPRVPAPPAEPLSDKAAQNLLKRLPPIKSEADDEKDFALRDRSLPPPRTGQTVSEAFPPSGRATAPETSSGPLEVLRFAPEGEVPIAPHLSVTFSQPMVPVTSNSDLAAQAVPVRLSPQPKGRWRWIGTKTLLFEPEGRFPMATNYTVEIPAGTKSINGGTLAAPKRWTFSTPPLQIKTKYPVGAPHPRNPVIFIEFDQRIDPQALLKYIELGTSNRETNLRLATAEEVAGDENARQMANAANKDYWTALRATGGDADKPLLTATNYTVTIKRGAPSVEGNRVTTSPQSFDFQTYGPLQLIKHDCGGHQRGCEPGWPWILQFNNPLDLKAFDKTQIRVEPDLPGMKVSNYGQIINIQGASRGRTTYKVTLDASLRDHFGQTLGDNKTVTFNVGPASPNLAASVEGLAVLDPFAAPRFSIFSVNHSKVKVSLYSVGPEHWDPFNDFMRTVMQYGYQRGNRQRSMPAIGRLVYAKVIDIVEKPDDLTETAIDLKPALSEGFGQMILNVEAVQPAKTQWERRSIQVWIQSTDIGLDAYVDQTNLLGWATSLRDGKPLGDVQMKIVDEKSTTSAGDGLKTGNDGLARIELPNTIGKKLLIASKGKDLAILPEDFNWWNNHTGWMNQRLIDSVRWHVFDDRGMYKPGEEVHIKGWLRRISAGPQGDVGLFDNAENVNYTLRDSRGNEILKGSARINALGGFDTSFKLPPTMNLGYGLLEMKMAIASGVEGDRHYHNFRVQEFRRPDYEVKATSSQGPHFIGSHANLTAAASYYAGGGLPNAEVRWNVTATPTNYTPPNRSDFIFGKWIPWWGYHGVDRNSKTQEFAGRTDAAGKHYLRIDFDSVDPPRPTNVTAFANVQDVNRQNFGGSVNLLVHPSELYVGIRSSRLFVQKGEPIFVESIVSDLDGKLIANREIRMRAALIDWVFEKGEYRQQETNPQDCIIKSGNEPVKCRFETKEGGVYRITASVIDDRERRNESEMTVWVAGGKQPPQRALAQEKVELIPDRKDYRSGETAEILVQAPFFPAEGVVTLRHSGLAKSERFTMSSASHTLKIPISDDLVPNIHVQVDLVGASSRTDSEGKPDAKLPKRPAFASGTLNLTVPPAKRKLAVTVTPRDKETEPGAETYVDVELRDAGGQPVSGGEVALVVVDEAVLTLTNYKLADPLDTFYAIRGDIVRNHHLRSRVQLGRADDLISQLRSGSAGGNQALVSAATAPAAEFAVVTDRWRVGDLDAARADRLSGRLEAFEDRAQAQEPIHNRLDFNALAAFVPTVTADSNGRASVKVKLPDNLTRYRVMVVAAAGEKQFGSAESSITARLPLMVRPSAPRFLNFGDKIELPVVVQNQTEAPMQVELAMRASNAQLTAGQGRRITVPANDRVEVRFPAAAAKPGTARFQIVGASGRWSDAAEVSLPVWTPATTEAFATYGEVDAGALIQPVKAPSDAIKQFGGLEVTTSSTQLQALTDAVIYLTTYPFECAEQVASRVLAIAALRDVLAAFDAKGLPKADELIASIKRDMERLRGLQNGDGGFGFWRRDYDSWPYLSIHVAHTLQRAKEKGFDVPPEMFERSKNYIRNIEQHIPSWYGVEARRVLISYSLYVRTRMGDRDAGKARRLIADAGGANNLPLEALGWLLPVLSGNTSSQAEVAAIRLHFNNRAEETAAAAHFTTSYKDGAHLILHSDRRADAIILEALIGDDPKNDLIPKIVRGLLAHRKQGRWSNTQENAFVLLALDRYFAVYEKATPDFVARAWLGEAYAGGHEFRGRTTERHQIEVPMSYLMGQGGAQNLVLSKEGAGRMYYRIGMKYAPESLQLKPADYGFTVTRVYEAIEDANDVRREEDGTWRIKAGAQVRVRLTMVAQARRYHVALVDPLPAGLEAENPALATTGPIPQDPKEQGTGSWWWWRRPWFEHQNMRDERVEAFASILWEGVHNYSYVARATTPGVFVVPPAKAEEMYHPETYGRGGTDRVVIE